MVTTVAFHPRNENYVISGGCDGTARIWRPADHACVAQTDVNAVITAAQFCGEGKRAYLGTYDGRLLVLDVREATQTPGENANNQEDLQRSFGALVPVRKADDKLHVAPLLKVGRSVNLRVHRRKRRKPGAKVTALALDAGCKRTMALCSDGRLHVVEGDGEPYGRFKAGARKEGVPLGSSTSVDGRWLLVDGVGSAVRIMDVHRVGSSSKSGRHGKNGGITVERLQVMEQAQVTCAALATKGVLEHGGVEDVERTLVMAVGGDDGSLRIVSCLYDVDVDA